MTRCEKFYLKMNQLLEEGNQEELEKFCTKGGVTVWRIKRYLDFCKKHSLPIGNISEGALRPLIKLEGTPHQDKVSFIVNALKGKEYPSQKDVVELIHSVCNIPSPGENKPHSDPDIKNLKNTGGFTVALKVIIDLLVKWRAEVETQGYMEMGKEITNIIRGLEKIRKSVESAEKESKKEVELVTPLPQSS